MIPGEYLFDGAPIELNAGRPMCVVEVNNTGDRPVQIGSHFHFFEVNRALVFDRAAAYGMRLDLPAGTAVRFEPGEIKTVQPGRPGRAARRSTAAAAWSWARSTIPPSKQRSLDADAQQAGFGEQRQPVRRCQRMSVKLSRAAYAGHYGPTAGDRIRLADTELIIEIEKDFTVYGEEVQFGGGKVIRDSQGQSPLPGAGERSRRSTWSSPTPSSSTTGASSRATSASATAGSSASARRAIR